MRYLALPSPLGDYQDAGAARFALVKLPDSAKVSSSRQAVTAGTAAAAAQLAGLTLRPETLAAAQGARLQVIGEQLRTELLAVFANWTVGEQYDFDGARQALNADLLKGEITRAIAGVTTFRPADTTLDAHRTQVLTVLNPAALRFAAVTAATTLEAIAVA